jgi:signal recognition particle receptor subunit beta
LKGVDGVVFVADSQRSRMDANIESMENLPENLADHDLGQREMPFVVQYNKRDIPDIVPIAELRAALNPAGAPDFECMAQQGIGVFEALKAVSKLVLRDLGRG